MTDQEMKPGESKETTGTDQPETGQDAEQLDRLKETTEKIWDSTKHAWSTATFKATQYKKLVQKKIDLSALHKKIHTAHGELGKLIDDLREAGRKNILVMNEVKDMFAKIDALKAEAAALEEEVELIRSEEQAQDEQADEKA